jgi:hypothetical protein
MAGKRFQVEERVAPDRFVCKFFDSPYTDLTPGLRFNYVSYYTATPTATSSAFIPLPYIEYNGFAVPSVNPQIACNAAVFPPPQNPHVYVVCQAPVNGTYQLFFYGFQLGTSNIFLWKQLTFNGENKNPRIKVDSIGNLHIVWESSRCGTKNGQGIYYGVLGASSRGLINEALTAALDKHAAAVANGETLDSLLSFTSPTALDLRPQDEYGTYSGAMWSVDGGGTTNVIDAGTITLAGTPNGESFVAYTLLNKDQDDTVFDGKFSQLSYQLSFNLTITTGESAKTDDDIKTAYASFKSAFTPVSSEASGVNIYSKSGKQWTLANPVKYDGGLIPLAAAMELNGDAPQRDSKLKHFMLAAIPEKYKFVATNVADQDETTSEFGYTGKYKFSLIFTTSADITDPATGEQTYQVVRDFGTFGVAEQHNIKIALHYAKLHSEQVTNRSDFEEVNGTEQSVRFSANIIVALDNVVQAAENFIPALDDSFYGFDIVLGVPPGGTLPPRTSVPYDPSLFDAHAVTLAYTSIAIGPHSMVADPFLSHTAKFDRNVSRMVIKNTTGETTSRAAYDEAFLTEAQYGLSLGLYQNKVTLSQVPITFAVKSTCPGLCVDGCDNVHVAYQSDRDGNWQIYYTGSTDANTPFRFDTKITESTGNALNATVASDEQGRRLVAWQDDRSGVFQIYAARSNRVTVCKYGEVQDTLNLADYVNTPDEYDPYDPYGADICGVIFTYTNETAQRNNFDFSLAFYSDREMVTLKTTVESSEDKTNWLVNGSPMPATGVDLEPGESALISYYPSKGDDVSGELYYVHIVGETSDGDLPWPYVYAYYCPVAQSPECTVPCVYTNSTSSPQMVDFRVSFYSDSGHTSLVLSANSSFDSRKWIGVVSGGLEVSGMDTASVSYVPTILPPELYYQQNNVAPDALLCGVTYYVKVESKVGFVYSQIDAFAFECPCSQVDSRFWRDDKDSKTWVCSWSGRRRRQDNEYVVAGDLPLGSRFPRRNRLYRLGGLPRTRTPRKDLAPDVFFAAWDAREDVFYSSAQGSYDQRVTPYSGTVPKTRYYKPLSLVGNFQNPTFLLQHQGRRLPQQLHPVQGR